MKDNKTILKEILSEPMDSNEKLIQELNSEIDSQLSKPDEAVDSQLIKDCVDSILNITEIEMPETGIEQQITIIKNKAAKNKQVNKQAVRFKRLTKVAAIFCICIASSALVNVISVKAFQVNLFEGIIKFGKDVITYNFSGSKQTSPLNFEISEDDPYGLINECNKYNLSPLLPIYIPAGYNITSFQVDKVADIRNDITILFSGKKHNITFAISFYEDQTPPNIVSPSKGQDLEKKQINGVDMYILKEGSDYTSTFILENGVYSISSDVEYTEFIKILESMK
jgi:hypothetical protein